QQGCKLHKAASVPHGAVSHNEATFGYRAREMPVPAVFNGHLRLPVIGAPMFIVSTPGLVLAQCKAGIVGSFPALNARPASQLDEWLAQITEELAAYRRGGPRGPGAPQAPNQNVPGSNHTPGDD